MAIYKVVMEKVVFVDAEDVEEAKDFALTEDFIVCDETIKKVTKSTKRAMNKFMFREVNDEQED